MIRAGLRDARPLRIAGSAAALLALAAPAWAQRDAHDETAAVANYQYLGGDASFHDVVGQSVQVYRLPIAYTIRSLDEGGWGAKLTFPVSLGLHELSAERGGERITERIQTLRVVPGVEFEIPVSPRWTLYPLAELGAGKDLEGGEYALLYSAALRAVTVQPWKAYAFRVGGGLLYEGATLADRSLSRGYSTIELGLDVRRRLAWIVGDRHTDISVYAVRRRFLPALEFEQLDGDVTRLRDQSELGLTLGFEKPFRVWLLSIDRLGLGYRFGGEFSSVRLMFGAPF